MYHHLFFCLDHGIHHARVGTNPFDSTMRDLKMLYSHNLNSNREPLIKLEETHVILPKYPVVYMYLHLYI